LKLEEIHKAIDFVKNKNEMIYILEKKDINNSEKIIKKEITGISIYNEEENTAYYIKLPEAEISKYLKNIFESLKIKKYGYDISEDYVMLKELGIELNNIYYDVKIAAYDLNPTNSHFTIENVSNQYLGIDTSEYLGKFEEDNKKNKQLNLFQEEENDDSSKYIYGFKAYLIKKISEKTLEELSKIDSINLFNEIEMPLVKV